MYTAVHTLQCVHIYIYTHSCKPTTCIHTYKDVYVCTFISKHNYLRVCFVLLCDTQFIHIGLHAIAISI